MATEQIAFLSCHHQEDVEVGERTTEDKVATQEGRAATVNGETEAAGLPSMLGVNPPETSSSESVFVTAYSGL